MRILFTLFALFFTLVGAHAQSASLHSALKPIAAGVWYNGTDSYNYLNDPIVLESLGVSKTAARSDMVYMIVSGWSDLGGVLPLQYKNGSVEVADNQSAPHLDTGDKVILSADHKALIFRDSKTDELKEVLTQMPDGSYGVGEYFNSMMRYGLAGSYTTSDGKTLTFSSTETKVSGEGILADTYEIGDEYDLPSDILCYQERTVNFAFWRMGNVLKLYEVTPGYDRWKRTPKGRQFTLTRLTDYDAPLYPVVSERILNRIDLSLYAGYVYRKAKHEDIAKVAAACKEQMSIMRNSIFARHGYIFKSQEWTDFFKKYSWYTPKYDDVSSLLNEAERINIEHLKLLESELEESNVLW